MGNCFDNLARAKAMNGLLKDNIYVKDIEAVDKLKIFDSVCAPLEGCITRNQLRPAQIFCDKLVHIPDDQDPISPSSIVPDAILPLLEKSIACNTAQSALDEALLKFFVLRLKPDPELLQKMHGVMRYENFTRFHPSQARKMRISTVISKATGLAGYDKRLLSRGLAEDVIASCSQFVDASGQVQPMDDDKQSELKTQIKQMQRQAVQCYAFAYRDLY